MGIIPPSNAGSCLTRGPCLIRWGSNLLQADCDNHTSSGGLCFDNLAKPSVLSIQYFITNCDNHTLSGDNHTLSGGLCFDKLARPSVLSIQCFITNCDNHTLSGGLCFDNLARPSVLCIPYLNNLSRTATTTPRVAACACTAQTYSQVFSSLYSITYHELRQLHLE